MISLQPAAITIILPIEQFAYEVAHTPMMHPVTTAAG